jgi:hypothetical protein
MAINLIRISPTSSVPSTVPLTQEKDLVHALSYMDDVDLRHKHVLNALYLRKISYLHEVTTGSLNLNIKIIDLLRFLCSTSYRYCFTVSFYPLKPSL